MSPPSGSPKRTRKSDSSPAKPSRGRSGGSARSSGKRPAKSPAADSSSEASKGSPAEQRLQKVLAAAGIASRRECELLIEEGRVEVDGKVVTELGVKVDPGSQTIHVDGELLPQKRRVYFAVNKPEGVVCTAKDPSGRPRVTDLLPPDLGRVFNVGRLDMASEGLILLTNDGELANKLTHPRHGVEKVYHVQVMGYPTPETLAQLRKGVYLAEGHAHFVNGKVKTKKKNSTILEVVLDEGRNREIRRVLARVGHKVQRLTRIAVGPVRLGELPSGAYRPLTTAELQSLKKAATAGPKDDSAGVGRRPKRRRSASPTRKPGGKPALSKGVGRRVIGDPVEESPVPKKRTTSKPAGKPAGKMGARKSATDKPGKKAATKTAGKTTSKATGKKYAGKKTTGTAARGKKATGARAAAGRRGGGKPAGKKATKGRPAKGKPQGRGRAK